jgi:nucleotide-binding universal stress UspA family protein
MRVLLGAGTTSGADSPAVRLVKRLRFNAAQVEAVRVVVPPVIPTVEPGMGVPPFALNDLIQAEEARAREITHSVAEAFGDASAGSSVLHGNVASRLLAHADETGADLIAVDGHEYSPLVAAIIGSAARGLLLGAKQSVLLAKKSDAPEGRPIRAVLATDHSEYADACWERLIHFWPRGIEHLTVLTAYPEDRLKALEPMLPPMGISASRAVHDQACARNDALVTRLSDCFHPSCTTIDSVVSPLPIHEAIEARLKESRADLLILGAKGHGLIERLTIGSVALREALTLTQSVLVVRS